MARYTEYSFPAPARAFVVRLVRSGDQVQGTVRQIEAEDDPEAYYPSEEMPAAEALQLAQSRLEGQDAGQAVYVELEPGVEWDPSWGTLTR
ncbi:hypothetical protein [Pelagibacterium montanilacus]|uniref:hypothetical protein n=1 Tax=Pelagibacterium montanilacus TaxID=2185280 RepID=UPI000F8E7DCE|nr:hypothetical protein [Pelagibacterium montanilacus]